MPKIGPSQPPWLDMAGLELSNMACVPKLVELIGLDWIGLDWIRLDWIILDSNWIPIKSNPIHSTYSIYFVTPAVGLTSG